MSNPFERRGRSIKSYKLARVLVRLVRDEGVLAPDLAYASLPSRVRAARIAGVHAPSEATWAEAVALVEEWVREDDGA